MKGHGHDLPHAACAIVIHETGLFLAVSRKNNPNALGLAGGKKDPGETPAEAAARELREETGLCVPRGHRVMIPVYSSWCPGGNDGVGYMAHAFLCKVQGRIATRESGRVVWVARDVLCESGQPFAQYNRDLFEVLDRTPAQIIEPFVTTMPLDPAHVLGLV